MFAIANHSRRFGRNLVFCCIALIFCNSLQLVSTQGSYQEQSHENSVSDSTFASPNYKFKYGVQESKTGNDFGHEEERNGHVTSGQYRVRMADGRLQIVTYKADKNGYRADVVYESAGSSYGKDENVGHDAISPATSYGRNSRSSNNFESQRQGRSFASVTRKINGRTYQNDVSYYK